MKHDILTSRVLRCFYDVYNSLGAGYNESIYSAALAIALRDAGISFRREHFVDVFFREQKVGSYRVDYLVDDNVILELKAGHQLPPGSKAQLMSYLQSAKKEVGLLLFFGPTPEAQRLTV